MRRVEGPVIHMPDGKMYELTRDAGAKRREPRATAVAPVTPEQPLVSGAGVGAESPFVLDADVKVISVTETTTKRGTSFGGEGAGKRIGDASAFTLHHTFSVTTTTSTAHASRGDKQVGKASGSGSKSRQRRRQEQQPKEGVEKRRSVSADLQATAERRLPQEARREDGSKRSKTQADGLQTPQADAGTGAGHQEEDQEDWLRRVDEDEEAEWRATVAAAHATSPFGSSDDHEAVLVFDGVREIRNQMPGLSVRDHGGDACALLREAAAVSGVNLDPKLIRRMARERRANPNSRAAEKACGGHGLIPGDRRTEQLANRIASRLVESDRSLSDHPDLPIFF